MNFLKNKTYYLSIAICATLFTRASLSAAEGFNYFLGALSFIIIGCTSVLYYLLMLVAIIISTYNFISKKKILHLALLNLLFILIGLIPLEFFYSLGALYAVQKTDTDKILVDANELFNKYPPLTCLGFPERFPCEDPLDYDEIPMSIKKIYPYHVLVSDNYVLIEKKGLQGKFVGVIIFRENSDPWVNEKNFIRRECVYCQIRITENMYWYIESIDFPIDFKTSG